MDQSDINFFSLLIALAIGLLIGIERGWSDRKEKEGDRIGGIRTFSLIGLLGGIWAMLSREMADWVMGVAFLAVSALVIVAHVLDYRNDKDVGTTTAFSMMLTFVLAAWAVLGNEISALGVTVIVTALLGYKPVLHKWLKNLERKEIFAGIKLLIISVVLLPLLPNEGFGPWEALNPYWIWWMVVLICGLSFIGYVAIKLTGNQWGILLTAFVGGLASSTAVTLSLSQFARQGKKNTIYIAGVLFAAAIMFIRVGIIVAVVNYRILPLIWIPLTVMCAGSLLIGGALWYKEQIAKSTSENKINLKNPFQIGMAIKFGILLGLILIFSEAMQEWYGDQGIYTLSIVSGLLSVSAIILSLGKMAAQNLSVEVAAMGIILAAATNTLVKGFIFSFIAGLKESLLLFGYLIAVIISGLTLAYFLL